MSAIAEDVVHIAKVNLPREGWVYLYLKHIDESYVWFLPSGERTEVSASTVSEAMRLARRAWNLQSFDTVHCGYRFTLPERDEIGNNALFKHLRASYNSFNGQYADDELGHTCIVREASQEALNLLRNSSVKD